MVSPNPVPRAATAQRPTWAELPLAVRHAIEAALRSRVTAAASQGSGFTPGFASRLRLADGRRCFVKAASEEAPWMAAAYRAEAAKRALLPGDVPAPALQSLVTVGTAPGWVVLVFDDIEGSPPQRPWTHDEATSALQATARMTAALTPAPPGYAWGSVAQELTGPDYQVATLREHPDWRPHYDELSELATRTDELLAGDTLAHLDLRDDNVIIDDGGRAWICDWNFPAVGPRWTDAVCLSMSMFGDGLDADELLSTHAGVTSADSDGVDCLLVALLVYFVAKAAQPVVPTSVHLRVHQRWYAEVCGSWLRARRGWPAIDPPG